MEKTIGYAVYQTNDKEIGVARISMTTGELLGEVVLTDIYNGKKLGYSNRELRLVDVFEDQDEAEHMEERYEVCESCGEAYRYEDEPQEVKEGRIHVCAECWNEEV